MKSAITMIAGLAIGMGFIPRDAIIEQTLYEVAAARPIDTVVMIRIGAGHGSGVVIDAGRGLIVTNAHVVGSHKQVRVRFRDGQEVTAIVLRQATNGLDLALVQVPPISGHAAQVSCRRADPAEQVTAIGHPGPFRWAVSKGHVAAHFAKERVLGRGLALDLTIWHGNSGGGLYDTRGRLIGITTAIFGQRSMYGRVYSGFSFAVSGPDLCEFLKRAPKSMPKAAPMRRLAETAARNRRLPQ